jgi:hypothetical protein
MTLLSVLEGALGRFVEASLSGSPTAPIATVGRTTFTVGQWKAAYAAAPKFILALGRMVSGTATRADYETVGLDVLSAAGMADPEIEPFLAVASWLTPEVVRLIASGAIRGDPNPMTDAQTKRSYDPGDPAARL